MAVTAQDIIGIVRSVTKEWTRQRKAEERGKHRSTREYIYSDRVGFTEVADEILPQGYAHASGNGRYTVDKRQFYYAVRDDFLKATGREITAQYFSQNLLVKYMNQYPRKTAHWKITASPRGTITIPNTGHDLRIPCGTIAVQEHLEEAAKPFDWIENLKDVSVDLEWPSLREGQRYQAVVYIEKEGFDPQLREARIAEQFDVVIASCKGQSVVAARMFVDHVCRILGGVPLLVLHDFDKSGFEISQRLTTISDHARENDLVKYEFKNKVQVTDIGLRLADIKKYQLKSERCEFKGGFPRDTIASPEERAYLRGNRRVELNAFTAPDFIAWVRSKLTEHLGKRLVPEASILEDAYRRALSVAMLNQGIDKIRRRAVKQAKQASIPKDLVTQVQKRLSESSGAWDQVLYALATQALDCSR